MSTVRITAVSLALLSGLAQASEPVPESTQRLSIDGALAVPATSVATQPEERPARWQVRFDAQHQPSDWQRLEGSDASSTTITHALLIDDQPPEARLSFNGAVVEQSGLTWLGSDVAVEASANDPSGGVSVALLVDGEPAPWSATRPDGSYRLAVRATDALGNVGERGEVEVKLDRTAPALEWQRLDARPGVADDIFDGRRVRLAIQVTDAGVGVAELTLGKHTHRGSELEGGRIEVKLDADALNYTLRDLLGNQTQGEIGLRIDVDGPVLRLQRNGESVPLTAAKFSRSDRLQLSAEDEGAGVAAACVEASIWYRECRELPLDLVGISPGRYKLEFRAADRLGNRRVERHVIEVLP